MRSDFSSSFVLPSFVGHILVALGLFVLATLAEPAPKLVSAHAKVTLTQLPAAAVPAAQPKQEAPKTEQKTEKKVEKPVEKKPEKKVEPVQEKKPEKKVEKPPEKKPEKKVEKPPEKKPEKKVEKKDTNVSAMPDFIKKKQQERAERRKSEAKTAKKDTSKQSGSSKGEPSKKTSSEPVPTTPPKPMETIVGQQLESVTTVTQVDNNLDRLTRELDRTSQRLTSRVSSDSFYSGGETGAQAAAINDFFQSSILAAIQSAWQTPQASQIGGKSKCVVRFTLTRDGRVTAARITQSSGSKIMDQSALAAVRSAIYSSFPPEITRATLEVEVPFECDLN